MREFGSAVAASVFLLIAWALYAEELNCENENNVYSCEMIWVPKEKEEIK